MHSALGYLVPMKFEELWSLATARTAWPANEMTAVAMHGAASSDPKPITLSGPPSDQMEGGAKNPLTKSANKQGSKLSAAQI
jgi:hypothetical protein